MTTERELRDLLLDEAGGRSGGASGWDDVVRRGRRRQRVRRVQRGVLVAVAVGAVATGTMLWRDDTTVDTVTPATTVPTTGTTTDPVTVGGPPKVTAARVQGVFVTVTVFVPERFDAGSFEPAFDLCTDLHPRVIESASQVVVELVDRRVDRGFGWVQCQHNLDSSWATVQLTDPLDDRTLLDAATGTDVPVIDGAPLLVPTALPAPFDIERRDERGAAPIGSWTFSWMTGPDVGPGRSGIQHLTITRWNLDGERPTGCTEQPVEVRGVTGNLCDSDPSRRLLTWVEDEGFLALEVIDLAGEPLPEGIDLVAIAQGLEPLGG